MSVDHGPRRSLFFDLFPERPMQRLLAFGLLLVIVMAGCRGHQSERPPIHPHLGMDFQEKFQAQSYNPLFEDKATMRKPVSGTVARGHLEEDDELHAGRTEDGEYVESVPIEVDRDVLGRGKDKYEVYCTPCHGRTGAGDGVIMREDYGYTPASTYHSDRLREVSDGYLYDVIANGVRNMPGYGQQIPVRDRWAIVTYIRALQRSQNASPDELPEDLARRLDDDGADGGEEEESSAEVADRQSGTASPE